MARRSVVLASVSLALTAGIFTSVAQREGASAQPAPGVPIQILALNDFHGNLQPPTGSSGRIGTLDAGGLEFLSTHIRNLRGAQPNTVVVHAGDLIGASPLLGAAFNDEPSVIAMNNLGLDIASVGNHEFDKGAAELTRIANGGCHPTKGCQFDSTYAGARFKYLAANVRNRATGQTLFPAFEIKEFGGIKVAFIGMTLEATPTIVTPSGVAGLDFLDEADTVNALVPQLEAQGVRAMVVVIHEGGVTTSSDPNVCPGFSGAIIDVVNRMSKQVDLVISAHTHNGYNCVVDGRPVTSAASFGRLITQVAGFLDPATRDFTGQLSILNRIVTRDVPRDNLSTALIQKAEAAIAPVAGRVIGRISATLDRVATPAGETVLGDVIADSQLAATAPAALGGAVIAFMNPGGIRADLVFNQRTFNEADGEVTYSEAFTVQPFGNNLTTITLTGAQIDAVLEQQFNNPSAGQSRILQVSSGFTYTWDGTAAVGSRINPSTIKLNAVTLDPAASYRVTVNNFLADGGDNFTVLRQGTNRLGGAIDLDALEAYFQAATSPIQPTGRNRIIALNVAAVATTTTAAPAATVPGATALITVPLGPPTTAATTTVAPTTAAPTTAAPTTAAPTTAAPTTVPPTTTVAPTTVPATAPPTTAAPALPEAEAADAEEASPEFTG